LAHKPKVHLCEPVAAESMASPAYNMKYRDALSLSIDLLCLLWLQLTLLDWLTSTASFYPYFPSVLTSLAVSAPCILDAWVAHPMCQSVRFTFILVLIASLLLCLTIQSPACLLIAIVGAIILLLLAAIRRKQLRVVAFLLLSIAFLYLEFRFILSSTTGVNLADTWLGLGLMTYSSSPLDARLAISILTEWGLPLFSILQLILVCAVLTAIHAIVQQPIKPGDRLSLVVSALGAGAIVSLILCSLSSPEFLTSYSLWGTWALSLTVVCVKMGGVHELSQQSQRRHATDETWRARSLVAAGVLTMFASFVFLVVHLWLRDKVERFEGRSIPPGYPIYVTLNQVSQSMKDATIAMEDGYFYHHHGFDWIAMHRALRVDVRSGKIEEGGSTITQQLAKNLFLNNNRTFGRKIEEAAYTVEIEHALSKQRILEVYLNTIDYGYGCHGITAAAKYYFHTAPQDLTVAQSAILVGLVPDPPQPDIVAQSQKTLQYENLGKLAQGEHTALGRMAFFLPGRYSDVQLGEEQRIPLDRLIYPYKDAWDRGATEQIPATWHGVGFYFFADPEYPTGINNVAPCLKDRMAGFLDEARSRYYIRGIDHLGVYDDRTMRQSAATLSAHAYGQAIDISGFRFADGREISVADHDNPEVARQLAHIETLLRRHFDIVVVWHEDPLRHETHFHCEVRGARSSPQRSSDGLIVSEGNGNRVQSTPNSVTNIGAE